MTNIAKTINSYIKESISNVSFYNDMFPDVSTEGIISIHDPCPRIIADYVDGTKEYQLKISYTSRYKKAVDARSKLDSILNLLDGARLLDTTDNINMRISCAANVQFLGTDDKSNTLYTCSITVDYKSVNF